MIQAQTSFIGTHDHFAEVLLVQEALSRLSVGQEHMIQTGLGLYHIQCQQVFHGQIQSHVEKASHGQAVLCARSVLAPLHCTFHLVLCLLFFHLKQNKFLTYLFLR